MGRSVMSLLLLALLCAILHPTASRPMSLWDAVEQKNAPLAVENGANHAANSRKKRSIDGTSLHGVDTVQLPTLWEAVWQKDVSLVAKILASGANVNQKLIGDQWSVLHDVVGVAQNVELTALLLRSGADVDARNRDNKTPLFEASYYGNDKIVALLLQYGADQSIACNSTWCIASGVRTPREVATMWCHTNVVQLLTSGVPRLPPPALRPSYEAEPSHPESATPWDAGRIFGLFHQSQPCEAPGSEPEWASYYEDDNEC